jgi:hypothetical protein
MARPVARGGRLMPRGVHPNSRANLERNRQSFPPAPVGNQRRRVHGGYAVTKRGPVSEFMCERFYETLSADSPLRDDPKFAHLVALASGAFQRLADLKQHIDTHGADIGSARVQGWLDREAALRRECTGYLTQLGMAPAQREDELSAFVSDLRARVEALRAEHEAREAPPAAPLLLNGDVPEVADGRAED